VTSSWSFIHQLHAHFESNPLENLALEFWQIICRILQGIFPLNFSITLMYRLDARRNLVRILAGAEVLSYPFPKDPIQGRLSIDVTAQANSSTHLNVKV